MGKQPFPQAGSMRVPSFLHFDAISGVGEAQHNNLFSSPFFSTFHFFFRFLLFPASTVAQNGSVATPPVPRSARKPHPTHQVTQGVDGMLTDPAQRQRLRKGALPAPVHQPWLNGQRQWRVPIRPGIAHPKASANKLHRVLRPLSKTLHCRRA